MKKNFTPIKHHKHSKHHPDNPVRVPILFILGFCLYIFICINIAASQSVPALYYDFAQEKEQAVVQTLFQIQRLPEYPYVLGMQRAVYGPGIDASISKENDLRSANIQTLEAVLQTNPEDSNVLYSLSILYKENGQNDMSRSYLEKAQKVNPSLN
jgi:hypothetical protein